MNKMKRKWYFYFDTVTGLKCVSLTPEVETEKMMTRFGISVLLPKVIRAEIRACGGILRPGGTIDGESASVRFTCEYGPSSFGFTRPGQHGKKVFRAWGGIWTMEEFLKESETEFPEGLKEQNFSYIPRQAIEELLIESAKRGF